MIASNISIARKSRLMIYLTLILLFIFSCNPYNQNSIFLYKVNGYPVSHLVWSPTGRQLVFTSYSGSLNASSIYILDIETEKGQLFMTTDHGRLEALGWTPDETELIFSANSSNEFSDGIWTTKISSQVVPKLYIDGKVAFGWFPTDQIAVSGRDQEDNLLIYLRDSKTHEEKVVFHISEGSLNSPLSWSTDGSKLAFSLRPGQSYRRIDLYIIDLETGESRQLTNEGINDSPSLSPNGKMMVYRKGDFSGQVPSYSMHIMNTDGTCDIEVPDSVGIASPAWSPDGKWIAFVGKGNRIFLLDLFATFGEGFPIKGLPCK